MAKSSNANIIVDPDGDLILLLDPAIPKSSKSDDSSSADTGSVKTPDDEICRESQMTQSVEVEPSEDEPIPIYNDSILVSSKHMSLASPVFKAMLQGGFQEAITLKETGKLEVPLPDDDPAAMKILIDAIHGRMKSVPLKIELELLTQLAILVDKYQCPEVLLPYPVIWKNKLQDWTDSSSDIARWLCIAWQFELDDEFLRATKWIQEQGTCDLETTMATMKYNLPIPKQVTDKMEMRRLEGIRKAVKILEDLITKYQHPAIRCTATEIPQIENKDPIKTSPSPYQSSLYQSSLYQTYPTQNLSNQIHPVQNHLKQISFLSYDHVVHYRRDCDSMLLGSLTKSAIINGLFPLPAPPYTSWSLNSLLAKMQLLEASNLCSKLLKTSVVQHGVIDGLRYSIRNIDKSGLTLKACKKLVGNT
ncbi:hypothetical protein BCON_0079g00030 [Botryotinia convoluta]|uniref:BTB domain-containing protein n=1 Tax=Botryotinia convoluta TaxID=54673 RepID=A0A4Z1I3Q5_9HELO|nr:hypothetical protein BCON_0079g00030 [Botryotinia convoluta]